MDNRIDIYYKLSNDDSVKFTKIDNFLGLSKRFSKGSIHKRKIYIIAGGLAAEALAGSLLFIAEKKINVFIVMAVILMFSFLAYVKNDNNDDTDIPVLERAKNIFVNDGADEVSKALDSAKPICGSESYIGGKYIFTMGLGMCRIEDITRLYIRVESYGRGRVYYACAEIMDETGHYRHDLKELVGTPGMRNKQFDNISSEIMGSGYFKLHNSPYSLY